MAQGRDAKGSNGAVAIGLVAVVFAISLACFIVRLPPSLGIHDNTVTDLLQAKQCLEEGQCATAGQRSTFGGLVQGGGWPAYLVLCLGAGLDIDGVARVSAVLAALAVALLAWLAWRLAGLAAGLLAAAAFLAGLVLVRTVLDIQWNPSLLPLPVTGFLVALALAFKTRHWGWVAGAALLGALACQIHLLAAVPFGMAVVFLFLLPPRQPVVAGVVAVSLVAASVALLSGEAVKVAWHQLVGAAPGGDSTTVFHQHAGPIVVLLVTIVASLWVIWRQRRSAEQSSAVIYLYIGACTILLLLLSLVGGIALVPHYLVPFLPGIALVIGIALTSWPPAWGSRQLGPLQLLVWGRVAAVAVLVTAAVGLADSSAVEPPTEHSFADARALSLELEGFGVSDLRTAACRIRAPQRFHLLAGLATELPAGDLSMACDPDAEDLLVIHSVTPPGKDYPEGWRAIRSGEQWLHIIPRRPHLDWHGARRSGSEGYVAVSPGLDPTCHTPAMPVVYGMCDHDLGSDVALRVPVQASHPEAMNVVVLTGRHRATTHVAVTRHADKLDIHWIPGIPGRFDVLGLPLVVLLGPDEEQLEVLLRE